jgi:hypothetical protein
MELRVDLLVIAALVATTLGASAGGAVRTPQPIRAFCIDFNWGDGGVGGFAKPGLWADASPAEHVAWYKALGCNTIQTFAVSCNGYAWYKGGRIPAQPGLEHDFLPEVVRLGHKHSMKVMGYFCAAANLRWSQTHPELSYGAQGDQCIPFTDAYLDYLGQAVEEGLRLGKMDGFMVDWLFCPSDSARQHARGRASPTWNALPWQPRRSGNAVTLRAPGPRCRRRWSGRAPTGAPWWSG